FYTITVETKNIENLNYMHLIDNIKNTEIDLLVEPSYTFKASESDNADRFYLVFDFNNYTGVNENYTNDNFAHQIGDEIFVSGEGTLQVFDVLGRFVTGYNVNGDKRISTDAFNTGVYIFRMVGTEVKTQKIIVR
ncbi:MAG: T9SS type A sorting domain-containing protein, partial [Bacteroidales bacterium]|nr:T9SS type A sorting domain-containing protein [Bacteroidales bacterium]